MAKQQEVILRAWEFDNSEDISTEDICNAFKDIVKAGDFSDIGVYEGDMSGIPCAVLFCTDNNYYLKLFNYLTVENGSLIWVSSVAGKGSNVNAKDLEKLYQKASGAWDTFKGGIAAGKSMASRFNMSGLAGGISGGIGAASGLAIRGAAGLAAKGVRALMRDNAAYEKEMDFYKKALGIIDYAAGGVDTAELIPAIEEQANLENSIAQYNLGRAFAEGRGVEADEQLAFEWFERAAANGEMRSRNIVCSEYLYGEHEYDLEKKRTGLAYLIDLANNGAEWAPELILDIFFMGNIPGLPEDYEKAVFYANKYANEGNADAMQMISAIYDSAINTGVIPELAEYRDDEKAILVYQKLIEKKHPEYSGYAAFNLGNMFAEGRGVVKDEDEAISYYDKASAFGNIDAKKELMRAYYLGKGVEKSNEKAARYANEIVDRDDEDHLPAAYYCLHKCADEEERFSESMKYAKQYISCPGADPEIKSKLHNYLDEMEERLGQMTEAEKKTFLKEPQKTKNSSGGILIAVILVIVIAVVGLIIYMQNNDDGEYEDDDSYSSEEYEGEEDSSNDENTNSEEYEAYFDEVDYTWTRGDESIDVRFHLNGTYSTIYEDDMGEIVEGENAGTFEYNNGTVSMTGKFGSEDVTDEKYGDFHANGFSGEDGESDICFKID